MAVPKLQLLSRTQYDTDGTTTVWDFNFSGGYILQDHVKAYYDSVGGVRTPVVVTPAMLIGTWQLQITPAIPAGNVLTIYRATPKDRPMVDFTDRGYISEVALDTLARQAVFVAAEASDDTVTANSEVAVNAAAQAQAGQAGAVAASASAVAAAAATDVDRIAADASAVAAANAATAATNAATAAAGDNLLINGTFAINQRGYTGAPTIAANQYTLDRWRIVTSGEWLVFGASLLSSEVTAPAGGLEQVVEANNIFGGTYVLNWTGTATATVNGTARTKGEAFYITAGYPTTVRFSSGTVSLAKLQSGSLATAYKHRPVSTELALCQRYYQMFSVGFTSSVTAGGYYGGWVPFVVPMRAAPTVALFNPVIASAFATTVGGLSSVRADGVFYSKVATAASQGGQYLDILSANAEL